MQKVPPLGALSVDESYVNKNAGASIAGSKVPAEFFNAVNAEISNLISGSGQTPSSGDMSQVLKAISRIAGQTTLISNTNNFVKTYVVGDVVTHQLQYTSLFPNDQTKLIIDWTSTINIQPASAEDDIRTTHFIRHAGSMVSEDIAFRLDMSTNSVDAIWGSVTDCFEITKAPAVSLLMFEHMAVFNSVMTGAQLTIDFTRLKIYERPIIA